MKKVIVITGASSGFGALTARALAKAGHETSIIVPGAFTGGTNHFAHAGSPADKARVGEYEAGPIKVSRTMYSKVSPQSCLLMQMSRALRTPSSR